MAEVTSELIYELLKKIHQRMDRFDLALGEVKHEMVAIRLQALSTQTDINNIYAITSRIDQRLDRIEQRLELRELAEPQAPFER
jgi:hypothetical protein